MPSKRTTKPAGMPTHCIHGRTRNQRCRKCDTPSQCVDMAQIEGTLRALLRVALIDDVEHVYIDACPDRIQPDARDAKCQACRVIVAAEKLVTRLEMARKA